MKITVNLGCLRHHSPAQDKCSGSGSVANIVEFTDKAIFSSMDNAGVFLPGIATYMKIQD